MNIKKLKKTNVSKSNQMIESAMNRRRALAYRAIAKICNLDIKIRVIK